MSKSLILIDGIVYDVTNFKHPGGSVIKSHYWSNMNQVDASIAFKQFHMHNEAQAVNYLRSLPIHEKLESVAYDQKNKSEQISTQIVEDFKILTNQLKAEGFYEPDLSHTITRFIRDFALYGLGLYLMCTSSVVLSLKFFLGFFIACVGFMFFGWLEHELGHHSIVKNNSLARFLQTFIFNIILSGSVKFWNYQHNWHHASTQHVDQDIDLKTFPLLVFHEDVLVLTNENFQTNETLQTNENLQIDSLPFLIRYQHLTWFWLNNLMVSSLWKYIIHPRFELRKGSYQYILTAIISEIMYLTIFTMGGGFSLIQSFILSNVLKSAGLAFLLFNFSVSHTTQPVHNGQYVNWIDLASKYTVNVESNFLVDTWMGFLNFQIEHHLFPEMPQFRHREVSKRVKKFFKDHDLPYVVKSYTEAVWDVFLNLYRVRNILIERYDNH